MKALMEAVGEVFLGCAPAGAIIAMFLALLSTGGALRDAVLSFVGSIC